MTSYFNSRGPARASTRKGSSNLADLKLDLSDEDARSQLQSLPVKNKEAKQALFAKHVRDFPKWLLPLRCANPIAHQRVTTLICNLLRNNSCCKLRRGQMGVGKGSQTKQLEYNIV